MFPEGLYTAQEYQAGGYPQLLERRHEQTIWTRYATIGLGLWLLAGIFTFAYQSLALQLNDGLCGLLLIMFGLLSLQERRHWAPWATCLVGIWMQLAPLVFWTSSSYCYLNDTLVGVLAIAFSILIPGTPGLIESGPEVPHDWSYNPSSWVQRLPIVTLAFIAWLVARFMAAYQLGFIHSIPDPFFGTGSLEVLTSDVSKAFPVSDAGLGAFVYTIETLMAAKGGTRRWHTMPWIVALFGLLVVPVGLTSVILIMLQPLVVGFWCFWCLLTAVIMLVMIALALDEVAATIQYLYQAKAEGKPFWNTFWHGSAATGGHVDTRSPPLNVPFKPMVSAMCWGITFPWNLLVSALIGAWLMFSPPLFNVQGAVEMTNHIVGAFVFALSIVVMAEVARTVRYLNILFGVCVAIVPWLAHDQNMASNWNCVITGALLILLSIPRGKVLQRYGSLDRYIH